MAIRKKEHDIALGNVIGSNLFNTLAVVGIAASIHPLEVPAEVQTRDWGLMTLLTFSLFIGHGLPGSPSSRQSLGGRPLFVGFRGLYRLPGTDGLCELTQLAVLMGHQCRLPLFDVSDQQAHFLESPIEKIGGRLRFAV